MSDCDSKEFGGFAEVAVGPPTPLWPFVAAQPGPSFGSCSLLCSYNFLLPVLLAPAVGILCSNLSLNSPCLLLCSASVFAIMKTLNFLLPKNGLGRKKICVEAIVVGYKAVFFSHWDREFPCPSFMGLQCFLPSLVL